MASDDDDKKVVVVSCKCIEISDDEVLYGAFDFKTGGFMFKRVAETEVRSRAVDEKLNIFL